MSSDVVMQSCKSSCRKEKALSLEGLTYSNPSIVYEVFRPTPHSCVRRPERNIFGVLVVDVDGTITVEGNKYQVDQRAVKALARFVVGGGRVVFNTGATWGRIERTVLVPLHHAIEDLVGKGNGEYYFPRIFGQPENGSALLIFKRQMVVECELKFDWHRFHTLHVPRKDEIRRMLEKEFVPKYEGSAIWSNGARDQAPRDYIVSFTYLPEGSPASVIAEIEKKKKVYPQIPWNKIKLKAARTTVDFVHVDAGKVYSVAWLLKEHEDFRGPVIGLGDLGDEFACVIPTINVNKLKPNEFRTRGMPAIDMTSGWKLLDADSYVLAGSGKKSVVLDSKTAVEMKVLRDAKGEVISAIEEDKTSSDGTTQKVLRAVFIRNGGYDRERGRPVLIRPFMHEEGGKTVELEDAGGATAWVINHFIDRGFFSPNVYQDFRAA